MHSEIIEHLNTQKIIRIPQDSKSYFKAISSYKLKIFISENSFIQTGRGGATFSAICKSTLRPSAPSNILKVGNFSQCDETARLIVDGEHANSRVLNNNFSLYPDLVYMFKTQGVELENTLSKGIISIGSNVVISNNATILSGVTIGDGAVIGAGAVVTKDVPPFGIVGGNPAKVIKYRFESNIIDRLLALKWWNFSLLDIVKHISLISKIDQISDEEFSAILNANIAPDPHNVYLIYKRIGNHLSGYSLDPLGVEYNDVFTKLEDLQPVPKFFLQHGLKFPTEHTYLIRNIQRYL